MVDEENLRTLNGATWIVGKHFKSFPTSAGLLQEKVIAKQILALISTARRPPTARVDPFSTLPQQNRPDQSFQA